MLAWDAQNGFASLHVGNVHGASTVLSSRSRTPLCMLTPRPRGQSVWAYTSSLGGGMVAGDSVTVDIKIDPDATCFLGTQSSSKIYRSPRGVSCAHRLEASIGANATLVLAPDPVQCFANAVYEQHQTFHLGADANLVLVDWLSAGRLARGERWMFTRYRSRNEVRSKGRPLVIDAVELDPSAGALPNRFRTGRFNCLATILLIGPAVAAHADAALDRIGVLPVTRGASLCVSASRVSSGVLLRFAGVVLEEVGHALWDHLRFIREILEDDPWARKW